MAEPQGVTIERADGTVCPCELVHQGVDDAGLDVWEIANATFRPGLDRIRVAVMPGRTTLVFHSG